jgi:hypothetical protein
MKLITKLNELSDIGYEVTTSKIQEETLFSIKNPSNKLVAIGLQIDEEFKEETAWFPNYNKKLALLFTDYNEYSNFYSNNYFIEFVINTNNVWFIPNLVINPVGKIENTIEPLINSIRSEEIRGSENK